MNNLQCRISLWIVGRMEGVGRVGEEVAHTFMHVLGLFTYITRGKNNKRKYPK